MDDTTVKSRYTRMVTMRDPFLDRARVCSKLTIPSLIPPNGHSATSKLPTPYQAMGARGVNNLAAKLLLALLPPNSPFFRLTIDDFTLEKLTKQEGMRAEVEEGLNRIERAVANEIETTAIRAPAFESLKHLIVGGNCLVYFPPTGGMRMFRLDQYVVKRDPSGNVLEIIVQEKLAPDALPDKVKALVNTKDDKKDKLEKSVELYTRVWRNGNKWSVMQEINGLTIPGSAGSYPLNKTAWMPLRFISIENEDYGRGYVEEYLGDLQSLEGLTKAIVQASAAAAKILFLVRPNSTTTAKTLSDSESGDIRSGNKEDVTVLQMEKYNDFRVALDTVNKLEERLSFAFLLNSAIQRNGERVTAEEIRYMANELESALGGIYSTMSQEFQLPMVHRLMHQMERQHKLPALPEGVVKPSIVTGVEAIGRGNDLNKLSQFLQGIAQIPEALQALNVEDFVKRFGTSLGIDMKGLVKTQDEMAQAQQAAQLRALIEKLGPNAINQLGGMAQKGMDQNVTATA